MPHRATDRNKARFELLLDIMKKDETLTPVPQSLSEVHRAFGLPQPQHPLISIINNSDGNVSICQPPGAHVLQFYKISLKVSPSGRLRYGQGYYDFEEGGLLFASPGQVIGADAQQDLNECSVYTLLIQPDFLLSYPLAAGIRQYGFFSYSVNELLHLSAEEKAVVISIFENIEKELKSRIDDFSQDVIIAQIELLLHYANRFYHRQFITRKAQSHHLLQKLEALLDDYYNQEKSTTQGIPTVQYLSEHLNYSPSYLSDMLRSLTGLNAQQHIHHRLIEKAKEKLSGTRLSVSEVAYELGFEHPQSFFKLFKSKTNQSPLQFRKAFAHSYLL